MIHLKIRISINSQMIRPVLFAKSSRLDCQRAKDRDSTVSNPLTRSKRRLRSPSSVNCRPVCLQGRPPSLFSPTVGQEKEWHHEIAPMWRLVRIDRIHLPVSSLPPKVSIQFLMIIQKNLFKIIYRINKEHQLT